MALKSNPSEWGLENVDVPTPDLASLSRALTVRVRNLFLFATGTFRLSRGHGDLFQGADHEYCIASSPKLHRRQRSPPKLSPIPLFYLGKSWGKVLGHGGRYVLDIWSAPRLSVGRGELPKLESWKRPSCDFFAHFKLGDPIPWGRTMSSKVVL